MIWRSLRNKWIITINCIKEHSSATQELTSQVDLVKFSPLMCFFGAMIDKYIYIYKIWVWMHLGPTTHSLLFYMWQNFTPLFSSLSPHVHLCLFSLLCTIVSFPSFQCNWFIEETGVECATFWIWLIASLLHHLTRSYIHSISWKL